jgi:hypothetical protein
MRSWLGVLAYGCMLLVAVALGASAQTFTLDVSASLAFEASGFSQTDSSLTSTVATKLGGVDLAATVVFTTAGFANAVLTAGTTIEEVKISLEDSFGPQGWQSGQVRLSREFDPFRLSATLVFNRAIGFASATLSAGTQTSEGVSLSSSTTLTPAGFSKKTLSVGLTVSGLALSRTTVLSATGLDQERWSMTAQVGGYEISRTTIFTAAGFSEEMISLATTLAELDISTAMTFGTSGFSGADLELSGSREGVRFSSATHFGPSGFSEEQLTLRSTLERLDLTGLVLFTGAGFQKGTLNVHTSWKDLSLGGMPSSPSEESLEGE